MQGSGPRGPRIGRYPGPERASRLALTLGMARVGRPPKADVDDQAVFVQPFWDSVTFEAECGSAPASGLTNTAHQLMP